MNETRNLVIKDRRRQMKKIVFSKNLEREIFDFKKSNKKMKSIIDRQQQKN